MFTVNEVHKVVTEEWGYDVSITTVKNFRLKHRDKIQEMQLSYQQAVPDYRLAYSRGHIEELVWLFNHRREIYQRTQGKDEARLLMQIMEQIRKETGVDNQINVNVSGELTVNHVISQANAKVILGEMTLMSIILGRVAARMGKNPTYPVSRLETSMYAKFNGTQALPVDEEGNMEEIVYPSQFVYDFDKINKVAAEHQVAKEEKQKIIDITPLQEEKKESTREHLLRLLAEKKTENNEAASKVDQAETKVNATRAKKAEENKVKKPAI